MPLRWDPLLVRELARELNARFKGTQLRALRMDGSARELALLFRDSTLLWGLHPAHGFLQPLPRVERLTTDLAMAANVRSVRAPADERLLIFELGPSRREGPRELVVELMGNQWNALVVDARRGHIRHVLVRRSSPRRLQVGGLYEPPAPPPRSGADAVVSVEEWETLLEAVSPPDRPRELVTRLAWTSPLNARALLGSDDLVAGYGIWASVAHGGQAAVPVLLDLRGGPQPYPWPLPDIPSERVATLLDAFARAAAATSGLRPATLAQPALLRSLEAALDDARRRWTRLSAELGSTPDPSLLRARGDLLLARLRDVTAGVVEVRLEGFDGVTVELRLDPTRSPQENAAAFYSDAAKAQRARERLPALIEGALGDVQRLEALVERVSRGEVTPDELRSAIPEASRGRSAPEGEALPYKAYRSSGGLEIRVGRSARQNDELTFHHSSPGDVWLHARHAAGAHVVLRWRGPGNPPARDLHEAAVLAALHSKARTSGRVPVDWTQRKYVRKARHSPPGTVRLERARTLFVEPDSDLAERLAPQG